MRSEKGGHMIFLVDIETNGLLDEGDTIHCLVVKDLDTGQIHRYDESGKYESIAEGVKLSLIHI